MLCLQKIRPVILKSYENDRWKKNGFQLHKLYLSNNKCEMGLTLENSKIQSNIYVNIFEMCQIFGLPTDGPLPFGFRPAVA